MNDFESRIEEARAKLSEAEAIVIGAGAGLSAAAGLDYSGPQFKRQFADYIEKYGFPDLYTSSFYEFPSEEERWTRWARHIDYIRFRPGAMPLYRLLHNLVIDKEYFVITTNVDGQFRKAGFDPERLFEVQGDYGLMQCETGCHTGLYSDKETVENILANAHDMTVDTRYIPHCPVCGGNMDVHVRKNGAFVQDSAWQKAASRYERFMRRHIDRGNAVMLELGVGFNTPAIIRFPFERTALENPEATIIRLNAEFPHGPAQTASQTISFTEDMNKVLTRLQQRIDS